MFSVLIFVLLKRSNMKIVCNSFTKKNPKAEFTVIGKLKGYDAVMVVADFDGQWYKIWDISTKEITISKVGHIGLVKTTDFSKI